MFTNRLMVSTDGGPEALRFDNGRDIELPKIVKEGISPRAIADFVSENIEIPAPIISLVIIAS